MRHARSAAALALALAAMLVAVAPAAAARSCTGAAARDAKHPCFNPTRSVTPSLAKVDFMQTTPCRLTNEEPSPVCTFGTPRGRASESMALVGDSHALQWRGPVEQVARAMRWRGWSVTAPGCPFSEAVNFLAEGIRAPCVEWFAAVKRWIARHPEVSTLFVSQFAPVPLAVPPGATELGVKVDGFKRAWTGLPKTVKRVIAIRDPPLTTDGTRPCLRAAIAAGRERPGIACRVPRADVLFEDASVVAARQLRSRRYGYADMSSFFCSQAFCYPVIGGTLVHRDTFGHISVPYAQSLGPYLLRRVRYLLANRMR